VLSIELVSMCYEACTKHTVSTGKRLVERLVVSLVECLVERLVGSLVESLVGSHEGCFLLS